jgi:spoIIIJ-associated protein
MTDGSAPRHAKTPHPKDRARGARQGDSPQGSRGDYAGAPVAPEELAPKLRAFLDLVVREAGLAMRYEISAGNGESKANESRDAQNDGNAMPKDRTAQEEGLLVRFSGEDEEVLLARNGELLLALEYLAHRWLRLPPALHDAVRFECGDFRANRLEELKLSARVAAQRVRETGQPFPFNPMSSRDRRIIHVELTGAAGVRTMSEGSGDHRHLVIYPAAPPSRK